MSLTPDDVRNVAFHQKRHGYDTDEVDRALDSLAADVEALLAERTRLVERLRATEQGLEHYREIANRPVEVVPEPAPAPVPVVAEPVEGTRDDNGHVPVARASIDPAALVILLGETRAMRSLLQTLAAEERAGEAPTD